MSNYLLIQVGDNKEEDSSKVGEDSNKVVSKDGEDNREDMEVTAMVTATATAIMVTREASATDGEEATTTITR